MPDPHSLHSTLRETILEHILTGELLRRLWQLGIHDAEILRSEFDAGGYDLVLSHGPITRHIQLKVSRLAGKTAKQDISLKLCAHPAGCVVWMVVDDRLEVDHYLWLGGSPDEPLVLNDHLKIARHAKADSTGFKADRPGLRVVPRQMFKKLSNLDQLIDHLFGPLEPALSQDDRQS